MRLFHSVTLVFCEPLVCNGKARVLIDPRSHSFYFFLFFRLLDVALGAMIQVSLIVVVADSVLLYAHLVRLFPPKQVAMGGPGTGLMTEIASGVQALD